MSETGWIIIIVLVVVAGLAAMMLVLRRDKGDPLPSADEVAHNAHVAEPIAAPVTGAAVVEPVAYQEPAREPAPEPAPPPSKPAASASDDLARIKGVGPKLLAILAAEGVTGYAQIAAWTDADIAAFDARNPSFKGRCLRDKWVEQARLLASGDIAGYEAAFGKL